MTLFQYAIFWMPKSTQTDEPKILVPPTAVLAINEEKARTAASVNIPDEYKNQLNQLTIIVRPF